MTSSSTVASARHLLTACHRAHRSFAIRHSYAWFPNLHSHRMRTRGALALRSSSSRDSLVMAAAAPSSHNPGATP
eukprot:6214107-Pleurochrysis_carterae.AAC.10